MKLRLPGELEDRLVAAVDLIGHTGAKHYEIGYLNDDGPADEADWWAKAQYRGTRMFVEHQPDPIIATENLLRQLIEGGICTHCGRRTTLALTLTGCRYIRRGKRYQRSCRDLRAGERVGA